METISTGTLLSTLTVIISVFLSLKLASYVYRFRKRSAMLSKFPQDPPHWFWGHLIYFPRPDDQGLQTKRERTARYPHTCLSWLGPFLPDVCVSSPPGVRAVLKSAQPKSHLYRFLRPWLGEGLLLSHGAKWARNRRLLTPAFHFEVLRTYLGIKNRCADVCCERMERLSEKGGYFEVTSLVTLFTLDVILKCAFSYETNCQDVGESHPYVKAVHELSRILTKRFMTPWLHIDWLFNLTKDGREFRRHCDFVHNVAEEIIAKRKRALLQSKSGNSEREETLVKSKSDILGKKDTLVQPKSEILERKETLVKSDILERKDTFVQSESEKPEKKDTLLKSESDTSEKKGTLPQSEPEKSERKDTFVQSKCGNSEGKDARIRSKSDNSESKESITDAEDIAERDAVVKSESDHLVKEANSERDTVLKSESDNLEKEANSERKKRCLDFLDILLTARDENNVGLTDTEIRDEVDTFLFEGHDTTASALSWTLFSLAGHAGIQSRVQREIDALLVGRDSDDVLSSDLTKLPYLTMCIKESLRLHCVVSFVLRHTETDCSFRDHTIPSDTMVSVVIYCIHHNPQMWQESMKFDPERFSPENVAKIDPFSYIPFSAGSRNCIGQNFAMHELKVALVKILHRFEISLEPEHEVRKIEGIVMKAEGGIMMRAVRRVPGHYHEDVLTGK